VDPRKAQLVAQIRERRERLDHTLAQLDQRVTEIRQLPMRIRADVTRIGRLTAIVVGVTAVVLASVLITRAIVRPRGRARSR
jgi:tetrahydromethanopterin S-methyltransferase subunit G